ncbi:MAG: ABC transporter substrate-binding protein [Nitrospinaceae bacterium]|nr:ABC transporter substrate-binding protein [Nitrospinaceae bacterium]MBT3432481.1 ABC transporter substrate-binding protein [Nitrospinaceae bacterium]MBT4095409.1 ABC transporter substrate-binding protein [Nitrospinaceae bacterium]MBT4430174.1 ABC transporter substrate-binding protein [Nitrospinaceae bacterium]MBT5369299.1 ABC transporter substrate-binding protein [Nitrospinaceae bacterium]
MNGHPLRQIVHFCLVIALLILPACGGGERPLIILVPVNSQTLDPHFATSTVELSILMNVFDSLITRRADMSLAPGLAERWEVDDSRRIWTFHLKKGIKFTNGEPFDSRSVKFTFNRMENSKFQSGNAISRRISFGRLETVNEHTVRLHTKRPVATLPNWLVNAFMLPPRYYSETPAGEVKFQPVGSGPYKIVANQSANEIRMEANETWWNGKPRIPSVLWRTVPKAKDRVSQLQEGKADLITTISPHEGLLVSSIKGSQMKSIPGGRRIYIGIRQTFGPFKDKRVRQAMNHALNFGQISQRLLNGHGFRLASIVNKPGADPSIRPYSYDPRKAKALLAEAGLKDTDGDGILEKNDIPLSLKIDVPLARYLKGREMTALIIRQLGAVGIKVELNPLKWTAFLERRRNNAFSPLYFHGFSSDFNEELDLGVLRPNLQRNLTHWIHPPFIDGYTRLSQTFAPNKRKKLSHKLQRIVREEAPWIFLWNQYDFYGLGPNVEWTPRPDERIYLPSIVLEETN